LRGRLTRGCLLAGAKTARSRLVGVKGVGGHGRMFVNGRKLHTLLSDAGPPAPFPFPSHTLPRCLPPSDLGPPHTQAQGRSPRTRRRGLHSGLVSGRFRGRLRGEGQGDQALAAVAGSLTHCVKARAPLPLETDRAAVREGSDFSNLESDVR